MTKYYYDTKFNSPAAIVKGDFATNDAVAAKMWAAKLTGERSAVLRRVASIMAARREEIVDWLIRESASTRIKASLE